MKFTANTDDFKTALTKASKGIGKVSPLAIIENVMLTVRNNLCTLTATNLEQYISTKFKVEAEEDGELVFTDTKSLLKAIKFFTGYQVVLETTVGGVLEIKCGNKGANQSFREADGFPGFRSLSDKKSVIAKAYSVKKLTERFKNTNYAASNSSAKPVMTGIHFDTENMVGCDGYRLALSKDPSLTVDSPFTVPPKAIELVSTVLEGEISINRDEKYISFQDSQTEVTSRLLEGEYLNYRQVMTQNGQWTVPVNVKEFEDGLKYLNTFNNVKAPSPIKFSENKLSLNTSAGTYSSDINTHCYEGCDIGFNALFMMDALKQFKSDAVKLNIAGAVNPITITSEDDRENFALVLPVRLRVA